MPWMVKRPAGYRKSRMIKLHKCLHFIDLALGMWLSVTWAIVFKLLSIGLPIDEADRQIATYELYLSIIFAYYFLVRLIMWVIIAHRKER